MGGMKAVNYLIHHIQDDCQLDCQGSWKRSMQEELEASSSVSFSEVRF